MTLTAKVISTDRSHATVLIQNRRRTCEACHASHMCGDCNLTTPKNQSPIRLVNSVHAKKGDTVLLSFCAARFAWICFLTFIVPLLLFGLTYFLFFFFGCIRYAYFVACCTALLYMTVFILFRKKLHLERIYKITEIILQEVV